MYSYNSSTPLLCREEGDSDLERSTGSFTAHDEDCSSGYDSTDMSDVESDVISSVGSCESLSTSGVDDNARTVVMKFKSTHALSEDMKMILEMPEMCDVTFIVGPRSVPVYGVRAILGTRSSVLYQLILRHMRMRIDDSDESTNLKPSKKARKYKKTTSQNQRCFPARLTIPIRKYDSEVFRMLIQYFHCGCAAITDDTVAGLLCGAVQFKLSDLADACWEFIDRCVISGRGENLLFSARCYNWHAVSQKIIDKVYKVRDTKTAYLRLSRESVV